MAFALCDILIGKFALYTFGFRVQILLR